MNRTGLLRPTRLALALVVLSGGGLAESRLGAVATLPGTLQALASHQVVMDTTAFADWSATLEQSLRRAVVTADVRAAGRAARGAGSPSVTPTAPGVRSPAGRATPAVADALPPPLPPVGSAAFAALIMSKIHYPWRRLNFTITFQGPRPGYLGLTTVPGNHIDVFVNPGQSAEKTAVIAAYELAHVIDTGYRTAADRARWLQLRGAAAGTSWFTCNACTENQVGAGDFSDVFAWWAVGPYFYVSTVAPPPSSAQLAGLTGFFAAG